MYVHLYLHIYIYSYIIIYNHIYIITYLHIHVCISPLTSGCFSAFSVGPASRMGPQLPRLAIGHQPLEVEKGCRYLGAGGLENSPNISIVDG